MLKSLVESCSGGSPRSLSVGHAPKSAVVEGGKGKGEGERLSFITFSQLVLSTAGKWRRAKRRRRRRLARA